MSYVRHVTEIVESRRVVVPEWTQGWRLMRARGVIGISQIDLARAIEIPRSRVMAYEDDKKIPSRGDLMAWADLCGVSYEWLRTGEAPDERDVLMRSNQ